MRKSAVFRISNASMFREIKKSLSLCPRLYKLEARSLVREKNDSIHEHPRSKDYRLFAKLAQKALERQDFREASFLADKCSSLIEECSIKIGDFEKSELYKLIGEIYRKNNQPKQSIEFLQKSLDLTNRVFGEESIYYAEIVYELAFSYSENYMAIESISYYKKFFRSNKDGIQNIEEAAMNAIIDMSLVYCFKLDFKLSQELFKKGIQISKKYFGKYNEFKAFLLLCEAIIYGVLQQRNLSDRKFKQFLYLYRRIDKIHKIKHMIFEGVMGYYWVGGKFVCALRYLRQQIKTLRKIGGDNQVSVADYYRAISVIYKQEGNVQDSNQYLLKSLIILRRTVSPDHPKLLFAISEYIDTLIAAGKWSEVLKKIKKLYKKLKFVISSSLVYYMRYYLTKGIIYMELRFSKKALEKLEIAKTIIENKFGANSIYYVSCMHIIAANLYFSSYYDESLEIAEKVLNIYSNCVPVSSRQHLLILTLIGRIYEEKGEIQEALRYLKQCFILSKMAEDHYISYIVSNDIAKVYLRKGQFKFFFWYLTQSINTMKRHYYGGNHNWTPICSTMINYYTRIKKYKAASKLCVRLLRIEIESFGLNFYPNLGIIIDIADLEILQDNVSKAITLYKKSMKICRKWIKEKLIGKYDQIVSNIFFIKARIFQKRKEYDLSRLYYERTLILRMRFYDEHNPNLCPIYDEVASIYSKIEHFDSSIKCMKMALKIQQNGYNNLNEKAIIHSFLALFFENLQKHDEALKHVKESLRICNKMFDKNYNRSKNLYNLTGVLYSMLLKTNTALRYFLKALSIIETEEKMNIENIYILNNIGSVYAAKGYIYLALRIHKRCFEYVKKGNLQKYYPEIAKNYKTTKIIIENAHGGRRTSENLTLSLIYI